MKILLVYPEYPDTFWSFSHALRFIGKKAAFPPLGLLTVAALLPDEWDVRLVDMNIQPLSDSDLFWADYLFISAMTIQRESATGLLDRCRSMGVMTVAGGPLFTASPGQFEGADHLVLGEAEITIPRFLEDLAQGRARHHYFAEGFADLGDTPIPEWGLIDIGKYAAMNIQYSRGCPFDCEFCDITQLFGRKPRTKSRERLIAELDALHSRGWRGGVFFVDDNFIGDKRKLREDILPAMISWQQERGFPFQFFTEASIDLADFPEIMGLMAKAGFEEVFIGIETPHDGGLDESGKVQNRNRDLISSVRRIQKSGLQVQAGFIVGFDSDPPSIFEKQISFIQESGIVTAMVGMLTPLRGTRLHQRLHREGRLLDETSGNNTALSLNYIPSMRYDILVNGYKGILTAIYSPGNYYRRVIRFLREYRPLKESPFHLKKEHCRALFKSVILLGIVGKERFYFWKLFFWSLITRPGLFPLAITFSIYGFHFRKITEHICCDTSPGESAVK